MDTSRTPALTGIWKDFALDGKTELIVSVTNPWGIVIVALAGIWLSWSTKYIRRIVGNVALLLQLKRKRNARQTLPEDIPLLGDRASDDVQLLARSFTESTGVRDLFAQIITEKRLTAIARLWLFTFATLVALLASGVITGGFFLTRITTDGPARLDSNKCGLWLFEGERRSEAATRAGMLDLEKEVRAAQFAEQCYGRSGVTDSRCKVLYQPTLPVSTALYTNDCPFASKICRFNQTVTFKTPTIDARALGINSRSTPKFRRSTVCTPLSMDYPYIQNKTENGTTTFTYHYGGKHGRYPIDYTYRTVGDPWDRLAPMYDLFAYSSSADDFDQPYWIPHPDLTHPRYSTLTIIFISSLRILYEEHSDDPLFPADDEYYLPGDPKL